MRPLDKVMDAALKLVPTDFSKLTDLSADFEVVKQAYFQFQAAGGTKEAEGQYWFFFASALKEHLGEPDVQWKQDIIELLQGKKDYLEILK